jgi:hypothetical protein
MSVELLVRRKDARNRAHQLGHLMTRWRRVPGTAIRTGDRPFWLCVCVRCRWHVLWAPQPGKWAYVNGPALGGQCPYPPVKEENAC